MQEAENARKRMTYYFMAKQGSLYRTASETNYKIAIMLEGYKPLTRPRLKGVYHLCNSRKLKLPKERIDMGKVILRLVK